MEPFSEMILFPGKVSFNSLSTLLEEDRFIMVLEFITNIFVFRIILVDVRNRSELVEPGKIPGSFNIPLHQIPEAFLLDPDIFMETYKFPLPDKGAKNVVLTCR